MSQRVLIVDDEPDIRATVEILLGRMGLQTRAAEGLNSALSTLQQESFDLVLSDMRLRDGTGLELVQWISQHSADTPVAVITAFGSTKEAVRALKAGAFDYVEKPVDTALLRRLVNEALKLEKPAPSKSTPTASQPPKDSRQSTIIGDSAPMVRLRETINKVARSHAPVFVCGESGTGKELVAREIHANSPRAKGPFIPVNCGAIAAELFESELFGHLKGSFSGAHADREGLFAAAHGGTLFLDEVIDLPMPMQVKLLRAVQERAIRPVGANREHSVDVRIVSAAQKPLAEAAAEGCFRDDLYFRLNVIELTLPPLRERVEDIPQLCAHLLERIATRHGNPPTELTRSAMRKLAGHPFPGNIRELENLLERACALSSPGEAVDAEDLHLPLLNRSSNTAALGEADSIDDALASAERSRILEALEATRWNRTRAAERLGISFRSLRYRLKKLGLDDND